MPENETTPATPLPLDGLVDRFLRTGESNTLEFKRIVRDKLTRALESICAFANGEGGYLILGIEDAAKAVGHDRVYGVEERPANVDELKRLVRERITPTLAEAYFVDIPCTLRDGSPGNIVVVDVAKGIDVHSILGGGTWVRESLSNRQMTADEITRLRFDRGKITAESQLADVPFELLDTDSWRGYASQRKLSRPITDAMEHLGLAKRSADGSPRPTFAAVLLFAEQPAGLLAAKASVRVFHYKTEAVEHSPKPSLVKKPKSFSGPILSQINDSYAYVIDELAAGIQMGPLGFEIVQQYPVRVIKEAITNAVIHRDDSIPADIHVRIFPTRIDVESPGALPGNITVRNIQTVGSFTRNPLIVDNLREFPDPPNLDAGEGVRMMHHTMSESGLYPPLYRPRNLSGRDKLLVALSNEQRPSAWDQIRDYLLKNDKIGNAEVRTIMGTDDTLRASKTLRRLVNRGLLVVSNPDAAKQNRRYKLAGQEPVFSFSHLFGKDMGDQP